MSTTRRRLATGHRRALMIEYVPAYVDESGRTSGGGLYVMAAVVVPAARSAEVRAALRDGLPPGLRRYHWRDEGAASRAAMIRRIGALGFDAVVVAVRPVDPHKTERARRQCLLRLLWELGERGVRDVVFESRHGGDSRDRQIVLAAQHSGQVPEDLAYGFDRPRVEPLLWLPDVVAGAASRMLGDQDPTYLDLLGDRVTLVEVP